MKIIVVGGGPAGLSCAITLKKEHDVILVDHMDKIGQKILASGNGRCNITNHKNNKELIEHMTHGRFLYSALGEFNVADIIEFFSDHQLPLVEEANNRMYPHTHRARDVLNVFMDELDGVSVLLSTKVTDLLVEENEVCGVVTDQGTIRGDRVVIATGGLSYPQLGSDGSMHHILSKHAVKMTSTYPVEVPLVSQAPFIQDKSVQGISLQDIKLSVFNDQKKVYVTKGDLIFTHFGISGPAALGCGEHVGKLLQQDQAVRVELALVDESFFDVLMANPKRRLDVMLQSVLPKRLVSYICSQYTWDESALINQFKHKELRKLVLDLSHFSMDISDVLSIKKAFVTGGGIAIDEINPTTFEHKRLKNLFCIGELLDVHGEIGGYNLTIAMVTGFVCAKRMV